VRLPIRNNTGRPLRLFVEVYCDEYEIPAGGEAIVGLEGGPEHSIDLYDDQITIWNEGLADAEVEIRAVQFGQHQADGLSAALDQRATGLPAPMPTDLFQRIMRRFRGAFIRR
jgi:hypothetical protein